MKNGRKSNKKPGKRDLIWTPGSKVDRYFSKLDLKCSKYLKVPWFFFIAYDKKIFEINKSLINSSKIFQLNLKVKLMHNSLSLIFSQIFLNTYINVWHLYKMV